MGDVLLTEASNLAHIAFRSYDRMFPNQDTMPTGGFGNLIALPLQRLARDNGNSVFIDEQFNPYPDQWAYLATIKRITPQRVNTIAALSKMRGGSLGNLIRSENVIDLTVTSADKESSAPHTSKQLSTTAANQQVSNQFTTSCVNARNEVNTSTDVPSTVTIIERNMLAVPKTGMSASALNAIRRLAAFANPDFYRAQAMRQPVYNKPRIIYRAEETDDTILLPRGCNEQLSALLSAVGTTITYKDERNAGSHINVTFTGKLTKSQQLAATALLAHDNGILIAPTGFGKTVIAANIIAEHKTNTLIILRSSTLVNQWRERLEQFLNITATLPTLLTKTGRISRRQRNVIGQIGAGRNDANGIIDIALAQSLFDKSDTLAGKQVKSLVNNYGMVIFDECHHVASIDTEAIARGINAKYIYGLTGTLKRDDGMQPITIMQCGPVRHIVDIKDQIATQHFIRRFIPRFTSVNFDLTEPYSYHDYLEAACSNTKRNKLILNDAMSAINENRTPLLLTKRIDHAKMLAEGLKQRGCKHVSLLYGANQKKARQESLAQLAHIPEDESLAVVATGSYIGEGFDHKRLDTLLLAAPVSVESSVTQYIGRLHRDNNGKCEVRVYDYIDVTIPMSVSMYRKRLKTYIKQGYEPLLSVEDSTSALRQAKTQALLERKIALSDVTQLNQSNSNQIEPIIDIDNFFTVFRNDIDHCAHTMTMCTSYVSERTVRLVDDALLKAVERGVKISIIVRLSLTATAISRARTERNMNRLRALGCQVYAVDSCNEFVVFDDTLVWFGTIEPLGNPKSDDCSLRFTDATIARQFLAGVSL